MSLMEKGYYHNYILQSSHCFWAARQLQLRKSIDEKDKIIDELMIRKLMKLSEELLKQGMDGLGKEVMTEEEDKVKLMEQTIQGMIK